MLTSLAVMLAMVGQAGAAQAQPVQGGDARPVQALTVTRPGDSAPNTLIQVELSPLETPRLSPKKFGFSKEPWEFPWLSRGYVLAANAGQFDLRFRVYSQDRRPEDDPAPKIARMFTTLWHDTYSRLKLDHLTRYNGRIVDVFVCLGGKAGGEQRFDVTTENGVFKNVNTIYFYDINSFTDPIEMAREVAHEYGHAVLPAIGGYAAPEDWANGYLGEKLFLYWIREGMASGRLVPADAMGVTKEQLDAWLATNVDELVKKTNTVFPTESLLKDPSPAGMDRYLGLALYAAHTLPQSVFSRSLLLTGSTDAKDYLEAILLAAEEPEELVFRVPPFLKGKPIWIPHGKGKLTGAKILKQRGAWSQVQPGEGEFKITNPR